MSITDTSNCPFRPCNQQAGHVGPHGHEIFPGFVAAPHGGDEGDLSEAVTTDLPCNCCSAPMTMRKFERGGAMFTCTPCEQTYSVFSDGRSEMRIMPRLYPSTMDERGTLYDEFLDYRISNVRFAAQADRLCGRISETEAADRIIRIKELVAARRAEILSARPWWSRWLTARKRRQNSAVTARVNDTTPTPS